MKIKLNIKLLKILCYLDKYTVFFCYNSKIMWVFWDFFRLQIEQHLISGVMPNAQKETTLIILTNDNTLTFEDVSKSLYSSNSKDSESVDFYLLSTE